ncbi:MAG: GerMN domain-containing protein [Bacillota bacterium]|nr:GerMN domain-containing protein [Bacillota bacterium]
MINKRKVFFVLLLIALTIGMVTTGCGNSVTPPLEEPLEDGEEAPDQPADTDEEKAVLYFANNEADKLVKEKREIIASKEEMKKAILEELIKGPQDPGLQRTIPEDVKVLGVTVKEGIASADFSQEIRSSHWGGSTGEILTVYSIVNTLGDLSDVEQVRFLIEGQEIETLLGHMDLSGAVHPDWGLVQ